MKLLVTRPTADSAALAALLEARGHEVVIDPMLEVQLIETAALSLDGIAALLFTSANGARAFAALSERRDIDVYAVGDRTAAAAREAGFGRIQSAGGDVEALARLVAADRRPEDGALLHVSGAVRAGNLAGVLSSQGFTVHHAALYEAVAATALGQAAQDAIRDGSLDGVLLFSPRTAKHLAELVGAAGLTEPARRLQAWCLSRAVADTLAPLQLARVHVAAEPTQASLLDALDIPQEVAAQEVPKPAAPAAVRHGGWSWVGLAAVMLLAIIVAATASQWLPLIQPLWQKPAEQPKQTAEAPPPPPPQAAPEPPPAAGPAPETAPPAPAQPPQAEPAAAPNSDSAAPAPRLDRLEAALDEVRVEAGSAAPKAAVTALQTRMDSLGPQVDALAARPVVDPQVLQDLATDGKRQAAAMAQLNDRLTAIEARVNLKAAAIRNDRTLVLAVGQIRDALAGSGPFEAPVAVIRAVAPDDADLSGPLGVLESHAKAGVPSRVLLAQELSALPAKLAQPAPLAPDAGILDRITDRMSRVVTVRRVDDGGGSGAMPAGPDRLIAEAGEALAGGDLAGTVQIMKKLDGAGAERARPWLDAAQARLDCEQAAQALDAATIRRLSATANAGAAE